MAPLRDVSKSAQQHSGVDVGGVHVVDDIVRCIDALVDGFVAQSGCVAVADLFAAGGAVTDMCTREQARLACVRCIPRARFEAVVRHAHSRPLTRTGGWRNNQLDDVVFGHIPIRFSGEPVASGGSWSRVSVSASAPGQETVNYWEYFGPSDEREARGFRPVPGVHPQYRLAKMFVLYLHMKHADGRSRRFRFIGAEHFESYNEFVEGVADLIMLYKACVVVEPRAYARIQRALFDEHDAINNQREAGAMTVHAAGRAYADAHERFLRARRQFPEEYEQFANSADDSEVVLHNDMFELVRLTPAQLNVSLGAIKDAALGTAGGAGGDTGALRWSHRATRADPEARVGG